MGKLRVRGIETDFVEAMRRGGEDANGQRPIGTKAVGQGNPCRHCLQLIEEGDDKLILAYRPFAALQPYAEVGPIFLHQRGCTRYDQGHLPAWFAHLQPALIRGYDTDDWIRYETANVVQGTALAAECERILADPDVAYVHIRSRYNCFQCRVDRAPQDQRTVQAPLMASASGGDLPGNPAWPQNRPTPDPRSAPSP